MSIEILEPGLLSTIQDKGRTGYFSSGFSQCGFMDAFSARIANILVSNDPDETVIESTLVFPKIIFRSKTIFAVSGADIAPCLDGIPVRMNSAISADEGSVLSSKPASSGLRSYMSVRGGFDVPAVMSSRSTDLKCKIGGFSGRKLEKGDMIRTSDRCHKISDLEHRLILIAPVVKNVVTVHVIPGPQDDYFDDENMGEFFGQNYTVSTMSDRMGIRLEGTPIVSSKGSDIISDGIALGSIQIPRSGLPIIMGADRQTTGGYAKIGTVATADFKYIAQSRPGDKIRFVKITSEKASEMLKSEKDFLDSMIKKFK